MKMMVFDLDGTLLDNNGNMPSENIKYLNKLKEDGFIVAIATGRVLSSAYKILNNVDCVNYIISDTGSKIYNLDRKEFIYNKTISKNIAIKLLNLYNEKFKCIEICNNKGYYKYTLQLQENIDKKQLLNDIDEIDHMIIGLKNNEYTIEMYNFIKNHFFDFDCMITQDSIADNKWLEILPKGASKYNAIIKLANYLNISTEEIMVFGDGLNDLEMIEKCKHGVAMANALDEVKEKATYITKKSNEELGVIDFLNDYLNN